MTVANTISPTAIGHLHEMIQLEVEAGFSGAVLVQQREKRLLDTVVGSVKGVPLTPGARFWIASIGKQFASAALFVCQDRGVLDMNDTISRFLPGVPNDKGAITLRQLLTHGSGLPQGHLSENAPNRERAIASILAQPLVALPGERFIYSNENYQLAAAILEIVTQQPYRDFVTSELLHPNAIYDTDIAWTVQDVTRVAPTQLSALPERLGHSRWGQQGWYSTAADLAVWSRLLRSGNILTAKSTAQMFEPVLVIQEGVAASGWFIRSTQGGQPCVFVRGNEDFGANGLVYLYPTVDLVIVILTHAGDKDSGISYSRALQIVFEEFLFPA